METFQEAAIQMLREFRTLLHHTPLPLPISRLLQLLALNMFAIDTTQLKGKKMKKKMHAYNGKDYYTGIFKYSASSSKIRKVINVYNNVEYSLVVQ